MMSKSVGGKRVGDDSSNQELLNEIGTISKALYSDKNPPKTSVPTASAGSKSVGKRGINENSTKDKKSFWNWKPLKALSHVRNRRFNCCFTLQVHKIEDLPLSLDGLSLSVHWRRRDGEVVTRPVKIIDGVAEIEEGLTHTCSVYGSLSGPHHSAKYEAKHFLLYAAFCDNPEVDLGKHRIDLTRLLPLTLEELEDNKSSAKWSTTFKLSGEAKGAIMNVSFGYLVLGDTPAPAPNNRNVLQLLSSKQNSAATAIAVVKASRGNVKGTVRHTGSLPALDLTASVLPRLAKDIKAHEAFQVKKLLPDALKLGDEKFERESSQPSEVNKSKLDVLADHMDSKPPSSSKSDLSIDNIENEVETDFPVPKKGIEMSPDGMIHSVENGLKVVDGPGCAIGISNDIAPDDQKVQASEVGTKESLLEEIESALNDVADLEMAGLDSPDGSEINDLEDYLQHEASLIENSRCLDDFADSVANEFLSMLGLDDSPLGLNSEGEPESPRERLLREFEKETGGSLFELDADYEMDDGYDAPTAFVDDMDECYDAPTVYPWIEAELEEPLGAYVNENNDFASYSETSRPRAKVLEDLETEALMREWGLNEEAFQSSPPKSVADYESSIDLPPEEPIQLPPVGDGLGSFIQTKNGGFLRSMNPALFRNSKNCGSLIMQVSGPVVVPAEMGSGVMKILQHLSSVGVEKLSVQANKVMPLEDITGHTIQQMAWESSQNPEGSESENLLLPEPGPAQLSTDMQKGVKGKSCKLRSSRRDPSTSNEMGSEYVALEDLAPLAMDKIEALSIEGLRIQCDMSDEDAPTTINATGSMGLEGAVGLQLLDLKGGDEEIDGLMDLSITLDEWMRLDAGEIEEDQVTERTSKILAAHHATSTDLTFVGKKGEKKRGKGGRRCGLFGNNFTVALMVQLRDPLRDYESVGTPMLALIQVERVFVPPKPKIYCTVAQVKAADEDDDEPEVVAKVEIKEEKLQEQELIPQYKINEVHVVGVKNEPVKKKAWGSSAQQQSGSRWLLANGMGKGNKNPFMKKPKVVTRSPLPTSTTSQPGDTLWSISARLHGDGNKWKELAALNPHIRNPDVVLPNRTTIRLR